MTTILVFISAFVPPLWRFTLWGLALLLSLALPLLFLNLDKSNPQARAEIERMLSISPSAVERFGLFTIIVLGEVIVGVVQGMASHHDLSWTIGATSVLSMLIAIGLWWIYFDFVSHRPPVARRITVSGWVYAHLFMTMGIAATGAAISNVVELAGEPLSAQVRWLLAGAVSLAFLSVATIMHVIRLPERYQTLYRTGRNITLVSGLAILLLGFTGLSTIPLLLLLLVLMLSPIFYGVKVWIEELGAEEMTIA